MAAFFEWNNSWFGLMPLANTRDLPKRPLALRPGARVRVLAPAGPVPIEQLWSGVGLLESRFGFDVDIDPQVYEKERYFAGSDAIRLQAFTKALTDPSIDGMFCARGGYGSMRIAPAIAHFLATCSRIPAMIGFSDITALHSAFVLNGCVSFHGPTVTQLERLTEESLEQVRTLIAGEPPAQRLGGPWMTCLRAGKTTAPVFAGNLSIMASLVGTPLACPLQNKVIVFEDVAEPAYRVDRMIQQLLHGGLDLAAAIVIGEFSQIDSQQAIWLESIWEELTASVHCPVVIGAPVGHESKNIAIPQGVRVTLDTDTHTFDLVDPWVLPDA